MEVETVVKSGRQAWRGRALPLRATGHALTESIGILNNLNSHICIYVYLGPLLVRK